ncbi:peptidoglycan-binding protein [Streptomyces sp. NPDC006798]|uniref:peptidoglycan-binding protein n=1 Tax=Streptomyces sp. NPDC006798 TaxID=3155462 RepID=UPI00340EC504
MAESPAGRGGGEPGRVGAYGAGPGGSADGPAATTARLRLPYGIRESVPGEDRRDGPPDRTGGADNADGADEPGKSRGADPAQDPGPGEPDGRTGEAGPGGTAGSGPDGEPGGVPAPPGRTKRRRRKRGRRIAAVLTVLAAGGALAVAGLGIGDDADAGDGESAGLPPNTAKVTRQTLRDIQTADGALGYGTSATVTSRIAGTVTAVPESGKRISRGQRLYAVDDRPVTLLYGSLPAYRALKEGVEGEDVRQFERNLRELGYTGFTVDDEFTDLTADAVKEWQEDLGLTETGVVDLGRVVFTPAAIRVDGVNAAKGGAVQMGAQILTYTGTAKAATVELEPEHLRLVKKGREVTVVLPDDRRVPGRVASVDTVLEPATGQEEATTKIEAVIALSGAKAQRAAEGFSSASVDVEFVAGTRNNVLSVPVAALLAFTGGGFGVEVVSGTTSTYLPVTTGLFAEGRVEISGDGVTEGAIVGMPK